MRWRRRRRAPRPWLSAQQYEGLTVQWSPGQWVSPPGALPGWNWLPPDHGLSPALGRVPWWVRAWYRTPLVDRYAHVWMWHHGVYSLPPLPPRGGDDGDPSGDRSPQRPPGPPPALLRRLPLDR